MVDDTVPPETTDPFAACKNIFHCSGRTVIARGKDEVCPQLVGSILLGVLYNNHIVINRDEND